MVPLHDLKQRFERIGHIGTIGRSPAAWYPELAFESHHMVDVLKPATSARG